MERWSKGGPNDPNSGRVTVSLARVLAHELAHLIQGCDGESTILTPVTNDPDLLAGYLNDSDGVRRRWYAWGWSATGGPFSGDQGEYDAIINWENPIAIELGEHPRFSHT